MLIGIVSSKEGHDESHNDDTKLGTNFWNVVDNVTIGLTQSIDTKVVLTAGVNFFLPLNIGWHNEILGSILDQTDTKYDYGECILLKASKE